MRLAKLSAIIGLVIVVLWFANGEKEHAILLSYILLIATENWMHRDDNN